MQTVLKCPAAQWSELHTGLQTDLADCAENHAHTGLVQGVEVADSILTILRGLTPLTGLVPLAGMCPCHREAILSCPAPTGFAVLWLCANDSKPFQLSQRALCSAAGDIGASGVIPVVLSLLDSLADLTKTKIQNRFDLLEVAVLLTWYLRLYHPLTKSKHTSSLRHKFRLLQLLLAFAFSSGADIVVEALLVGCHILE